MIIEKYNVGTGFTIISQDKVIYPRTYTFGVDGGTDESQITLIDEDLFVDQLVRVIHDTHSYDFIVSDKTISNQSNDTKTLYTYKLVEPLSILRGYKLTACTLKRNRYTIRNAIRRLFLLANFDAEIDTRNISDGNFIQTKLEFVSTNLYIAISEIARLYDVIPYLEFNDTYQKWEIKFQRLDGMNETIKNMSVFSNPVYVESTTGEGLAKRVYCEPTNIAMPSRIQEPSSGNRIVVSTEVGQLIDMDNVGVITNAIVDKIDHIQIFGFNWQNNTGSALPFVDDPVLTTTPFDLHEGENSYYALNYNDGSWYSNLLGGLMIINKQVHFILKGEYDQLTQAQKDDYKIVYIPYDDVYVYLFDLPKLSTYESALGTKSTAHAICKNLTTVGALQTITNGIYFASSTGTDTFAQIRLTLTHNTLWYYGTTQGTIPFLAFNDSEYDDTCYYNQSSKRLDPNRTSRFLQTYIDNMSSGVLSREGIFDDFSDIPLEATLIKDNNNYFIVNSVSIEEYQTYYIVTCTLAPFHAKRRDYIEADSNLITTDPSKENYADLLLHSVSIINLSMEDVLERKDDDRIFKDANNRTDYERFVLATNPILNNYHFKFGAIRNTINNGVGYQYVIDENSPLVFTMGTNIIFSEKALDEQNWNNEIPPQKYTNKEKEVLQFRPILWDKGKTNAYFNASTDFARFSTTGNPVKDTTEVLNYTIQLAYRGKNHTSIRQEYLERIIDTEQEPYYTLKLYDVNVGKYDPIPQEIASIDLNSYTITSDDSKYRIRWLHSADATPHKCFILFINDTPCIVNNYFTNHVLTTTNLDLYVNSEDGLPFQKGIR